MVSNSALRAGLLRAKHLLREPHMWAKVTYGFEGGGGRCVMGACMVAMETSELYSAARKLLTEECGERGGITWFNDKPETTHADIMTLFDRAIASLTEADDVVVFRGLLDVPADTKLDLLAELLNQ